MSAPSDVLRWGGERARTGCWRGDRQVAFLAPLTGNAPPSTEFLRRCLAVLAERGFRRVVTGALAPAEQRGFLAVGFAVEEHLHLLHVDLDHLDPAVPSGHRLARGRGRHEEVIVLDRLAFSPFWRFDQQGLDDALAATPHTRFRVAVPSGTDRIAGYAICGRSGSRGFVQRLAVDPGLQRAGTGRRLLLDGLIWMRRHRVRRAVVNTQEGNEAALGLYRQCGFVEEPGGLSVLSAGLQ